MQHKFKVHLLKEGSIKRLFKIRLDDLLQRCEENADVEQEWDNIKKMLRKIAEETVRK